MYLNILGVNVCASCVAVQLKTHFPNSANLEVVPHQQAELLIGCTDMSSHVVMFFCAFVLDASFLFELVALSSQVSLVGGIYHC